MIAVFESDAKQAFELAKFFLKAVLGELGWVPDPVSEAAESRTPGYKEYRLVANETDKIAEALVIAYSPNEKGQLRKVSVRLWPTTPDGREKVSKAVSTLFITLGQPVINSEKQKTGPVLWDRQYFWWIIRA